jgi:hypothetical protein
MCYKKSRGADGKGAVRPLAGAQHLRANATQPMQQRRMQQPQKRRQPQLEGLLLAHLISW